MKYYSVHLSTPHMHKTHAYLYISHNYKIELHT